MLISTLNDMSLIYPLVDKLPITALKKSAPKDPRQPYIKTPPKKQNG